MATIKELKELALHSVRGTAPANYTAETVDEALRGELLLCAIPSTTSSAISMIFLKLSLPLLMKSFPRRLLSYGYVR